MVLVWSRPLVLSGCGSDHGSAPAPAAPVLVLVLVWSWPGPRLGPLVPGSFITSFLVLILPCPGPGSGLVRRTTLAWFPVP